MANVITSGLRFDPTIHAYALAGCPLVSVTQVLQARRLIDPTWFTEEARDRGRAVHEAIHYLDEGDLDASSVDERITPYLQAYQRFLEDTRFQTLGAELAMASSVHGYAGTLDRWGLLHGVSTIMDIKTGAHQAWHPVQLAAYHDLVVDPHNAHELGLRIGDAPRQHFTCELCPESNPPYSLHPMERDGRGLGFYRARWREALNLTHWLNDWQPLLAAQAAA